MEGGEKVRTPSDLEQDKAMKIVKEVYSEDYGRAKTATAREALVERILMDAIHSKDATEGFVLLRVAENMATLAGDVETASRVIDEMAIRYAIDAYSMKVQMVQKAAGRAATRSQHLMVGRLSLRLPVKAIADDDYDVAQRLLTVANTACEKCQDRRLQEQAEALSARLTQAQRAYAETKVVINTLRQAPADPDANLAVGKYLCFIKGDWENGLPKLARGADAQLKALAAKELALPQDADERAAIGDGWWELANGNQVIQARAVAWYREAVSRLSGLSRAKVEKRIGTFVAKATPVALEPGPAKWRYMGSFGFNARLRAFGEEERPPKLVAKESTTRPRTLEGYPAGESPMVLYKRGRQQTEPQIRYSDGFGRIWGTQRDNTVVFGLGVAKGKIKQTTFDWTGLGVAWSVPKPRYLNARFELNSKYTVDDQNRTQEPRGQMLGPAVFVAVYAEKDNTLLWHVESPILKPAMVVNLKYNRARSTLDINYPGNSRRMGYFPDTFPVVLFIGIGFGASGEGCDTSVVLSEQ